MRSVRRRLRQASDEQRAPASKALSPTISLGRERFCGQVPKTRVQPDLLLDGGDATSATQLTARRPTATAATGQRLLAAVQDGEEIIARVFEASAGRQLRRLHACFLGVRVAQRQRTLREP
jgi:hypothetical protein